MDQYFDRVEFRFSFPLGLGVGLGFTKDERKVLTLDLPLETISVFRVDFGFYSKS